MKKAKAKGVMDGVPLTQEGVCQVLDTINRTENSRYRNIWYRELYVQRSVRTEYRGFKEQSLLKTRQSLLRTEAHRTVGTENSGFRE